MNQTNLTTFTTGTQTPGAHEQDTAGTIKTSEPIPRVFHPSFLFRPVRGHVPYISRESTAALKRPTGHQRESKATRRAIAESWGLGDTQDVLPPIKSKTTYSFWKKLNETHETVMNISKCSQNAPMTNEGRVEFSNRFDPRETASSSPSSMLINMGVSSALLKTIAPNPAVTHKPPSHAPAIDNDSHGLPSIESDIMSLLLSVDFAAGPSMSAFAQPAFDLSNIPELRDELNKFWGKGTPSSNSRSSLPSPGTSTPILHLPMGQRPEEGLGRASVPGAIAGNYITYAYAEQIPIKRPPEHQNTSTVLRLRQSQESGQHCAPEPSFSGTETAVGQGTERMGVTTGGAPSSYGSRMKGKGKKRVWTEIGEVEERNSAEPLRKIMRSDRTLGATVPRSPAFMTGQQWGLEPFNTNQAIGMGDQCDGEGRPLNLAKAFSLGHREG